MPPSGIAAWGKDARPQGQHRRSCVHPPCNPHCSGPTPPYVEVSPASRSRQRLWTLTTSNCSFTYTVTGVPSAFVMCAS
jgi:hypothetical protein